MPGCPLSRLCGAEAVRRRKKPSGARQLNSPSSAPSPPCPHPGDTPLRARRALGDDPGYSPPKAKPRIVIPGVCPSPFPPGRLREAHCPVPRVFRFLEWLMDESEESAGFALAHVCEGHSRAVSSVKYSPCGTTLASACEISYMYSRLGKRGSSCSDLRCSKAAGLTHPLIPALASGRCYGAIMVCERRGAERGAFRA